MEQSTAEVKQEEVQTQEPTNDGSVEAAAQALSGLLDDAGHIGAEPEEVEEAAPQGQAAKVASEVVETPADEAKAAPISLKIGDKEYTIPANDIPEEIREIVKDGLLMRADYTRKTQEVAEQRKAAEVHQQQIGVAMQTVQAFPQQMAALQNVEAQLHQFQNPELWQRLESDPLGKIDARQTVNDLQNQRQFLQGKMAHDHQQLMAWQKQQLDEAARAELPKVKTAIPNYGKETINAITEYAKTQGYTAQQMHAASYGAPVLISLYKAMENDKLQSQKSAVTQKVEKLPPKTQRSGAGQAPGTESSLNQAAMQRLRKSGSLDDATAAIKSLLG